MVEVHEHVCEREQDLPKGLTKIALVDVLHDEYRYSEEEKAERDAYEKYRYALLVGQYAAAIPQRDEVVWYSSRLVSVVVVVVIVTVVVECVRIGVGVVVGALLLRSSPLFVHVLEAVGAAARHNDRSRLDATLDHFHYGEYVACEHDDEWQNAVDGRVHIEVDPPELHVHRVPLVWQTLD